MPTINPTKDELYALQKLLGLCPKGALRTLAKKVDEAVKSQNRLENKKEEYNKSLF